MRSSTRQRRASTPTRKQTLPVVAAVAAAAALSAVALSSAHSRMTSQPAASTRAAETPRAHGSVAVRDPQTGELRDATPEELLELQRQSASGASVAEPIVSATGFSGLRLGDDQMTFTVATRNADGTVRINHAAGKRDAEQQVRTIQQGGSVAGKEPLLER